MYTAVSSRVIPKRLQGLHGNNGIPPHHHHPQLHLSLLIYRIVQTYICKRIIPAKNPRHVPIPIHLYWNLLVHKILQLWGQYFDLYTQYFNYKTILQSHQHHTYHDEELPSKNLFQELLYTRESLPDAYTSFNNIYLYIKSIHISDPVLHRHDSHHAAYFI